MLYFDIYIHIFCKFRMDSPFKEPNKVYCLLLFFLLCGLKGPILVRGFIILPVTSSSIMPLCFWIIDFKGPAIKIYRLIVLLASRNSECEALISSVACQVSRGVII